MAYIGRQPPATALTSADFAAGAVDATALATDAVTTAKILNSAATNAKLANSAITIDGSSVSLGGSITVGETKPTITSLTPSVVPNTATAVAVSYTHLTLPTNREV